MALTIYDKFTSIVLLVWVEESHSRTLPRFNVLVSNTANVIQKCSEFGCILEGQ